MERALILCLASCMIAPNLFSAETIAARAEKASQWESQKGVYAVIETNMGTMVCELYEDKAPVTVDNFIGLTEGAKEFIDPETKKKVKRRYYDGLIIHRVMPDFMIQGGCPLGNGISGPGYKFKDEIVEGLNFDKPGRLAMANAGPGTNGSQFFITEINTPWLSGKHTIFGQLVEGMDALKNIARVKTNPRNKPMKDVIIKKITIKRVKGASKTLKEEGKPKKND